MSRHNREIRIAWTLTAVPVFLWILALLFLFRVVNIFDRYLMKFPGPIIVYGAMLLCPLGALVIGIRMIRSHRNQSLGWFFSLSGAIIAMSFLVVVGIPIVDDLVSPKPLINPSKPRTYIPQSGLPVFPGAEGFGTHTPAGRGGKLIEVTNLNDGGPGSLRAALNDPSPRTIVFRVGGTIELQSELMLVYPFVTVAGQTAPGGGICIKGAGLAIATHDVLIQHIRIRPGDEGPVDADVNDAVSILGLTDAGLVGYNIVLDHVSASWSEDEVISTWAGAHDITISWSIISEALNRSRHRKETHSAGLLIGDSSYNVSVHHNLLAHNDFRNPLIISGGTHDIVNNVIYDWGVLPAEIVDFDSNTFINFIGNMFIPGPSTQTGPFEILFNEGNPSIFVAWNIGPHRSDESMDEWALVGFGYGAEGIAPLTYRCYESYATPTITVSIAQEAMQLVLDDSGAVLPMRDTVDARVIADVIDETGFIIDSPSDVGGYPELTGGEPPLDTDHDGMPDEWEKEMGLDPSDPTDGNADMDEDGYTNIEEYLHSLTMWHMDQ